MRLEMLTNRLSCAILSLGEPERGFFVESQRQARPSKYDTWAKSPALDEQVDASPAFWFTAVGSLFRECGVFCIMSNKKEIWKAIPDFPGYEVSNMGHVRSFFTREFGSWKISKVPQRILKPGTRKHNGRKFVCLSRDGDQNSRYVADLVLLVFVGPKPKGLETCHVNGIASDDRLTNLRYDTHAANIEDFVNHYTEHNKRYDNRGSLTDSDVIRIRELVAGGLTAIEAATKLDIPVQSVRSICTGKTYKGVGGPILSRLPSIPSVTKKKVNKSSKYRGVYWDKNRNKWRATIWVGGRSGKPKQLGYFLSEKKAAIAYDRAAKEIHGLHAHLNFPDNLFN